MFDCRFVPMLKNRIYISGIFGIILLIALGFSKSGEVKAPLVKNSDPTLYGTWGLTNYFDTIAANKTIAKYRLQTPTWFAVLIEIEKDSVECFGSIERARYPLNRANDTLAILSPYITVCDWYLIKKAAGLQLVPVPNDGKADSTIYIFRKRDDLHYCIKEDGFYGIDVVPYFNDLLFKGKYVNIDTNQEVVFADNGRLTGIEGFNAYRVRDYFGTLHPHYNLDVIYLLNDYGMYEQYNWKFSGDELLLTEFVDEITIDEDGDSYRGDNFILGKETIRLKRVEK